MMHNNKILITGASGFVGQNLTTLFRKNGYEVIKLTRDDIKDLDKLTSMIENSFSVINLAGANIINRWNEEYKKVLYNSRLGTTKALIEAIDKVNNKPKLFISTSAVGIYSNKKEYDEENIEYVDDFLGMLCRDWENEALKANDFGVRTLIFRFGIVMGKGGALAKMLTPFKLGLGGTIGDGSQAFSYIHIEDLKRAYMFAIENADLNGTFNLTAPTPTTNYGLTKALGKALYRPTIIPIPVFVLNLLFGEGAKILTDGQSVVPKRLINYGFKFEFKTIEDTIDNLIG